MGCPDIPSGVMTIKEGSEDCSSASSGRLAAFACIINSEVGAVLAVMRRNVRWGGHYLSGNDQREHSLIRSLMALRKKIFSWQHKWNETDPCLYLQPFLDIVQSDETGAPITGVALSAVYKILSVDMIDQHTVNAESAMQLIVDAVTSCRFEVTDPASEEVVLMKILQVLLACLKSKASAVLSNQNVCSIVSTCFRIVHQAGSKGELLQRIARSTMHELVRCIFSRLQEFNTTCYVVSSGASIVKQEVGGIHIENSIERNQIENGRSNWKYDDPPSPETGISDAVQVPVAPDLSKTVSGDPDAKDGTTTGLHMEKERHGIPCMVEIFHFLSSLLNTVEHMGMGPRANSIAFDEDVPIFALGLINSALELSGSSLHHHPSLLQMVRDDLFQSLMQFGFSMSPLVLSMVFSIVLNLYYNIHTEIKLQMEAFFCSVILRLAQGANGHPYPQQEVAMEALVDFCRQKEFVVDMYVNLDCDVTCSDVFENIVTLLSKSAIPVDSSLSSLHFLALDGLIAIIKGMTERIGSGSINLKQTFLSSEEYSPIWTVRCDDYSDPNHWVPFLQWRKHLKKSVMAGVDHFNSNPNRGLEFLQQAHLLPEKLDPESVACFFRYTPGLDKNLIGDFLGSHDQFSIQTLHAFVGTFDFHGMNLDTALRLLLETFRLPGESQKIQRILESFSEKYYEQSPQILANKDAALILSYSLIMLNTDQHNSQVKRKMTENEFIRNNRNINGGNDLPREYLLDLYHSICNKEICFTDKGAVHAEMTSSRWLDLMDKSKETDPFIVSNAMAYLDRDMFAVISGPAIAAISAVFDLAEEEDIYETCISAFLDVAKVSSCYHFEDFLDDLIVSLCGFTILLNVSSFDEPVLGEDMKARMATEAVFTIANGHGDSIRVGWRNILDCILRLHKLGLLPAHMASDAAEDSGLSANAAANGRSTLKPSPTGPSTKTGSPQESVGLISRFSRFFSFDADEPIPEPTEQQLANHQQARQIIEKWHIESIFTESKFLQAESLLQLAQALIWASDQAQKQKGSSADEDTAVFCLELLIAITLNNRDRIGILWQCVYEHITKIVQSIVMPCALVEKAVFGLLRICQRLLPYKEDLADELLRSLQLVLKLDARVADAYCEQITQEINSLVKSNAVHIRSQMGWRMITSLLSITARHPEAAEAGFDSLFFIMSGGAHLLPVNYVLCMDASRQFAESRVGGAERSLLALDLMAGSLDCLVRWFHEAKKAMEEQDAARFCQDIGEMWLKLVQGLRRVSTDQREEIRNHAVLLLQNCLIGADGIDLPQYLWLQCFDSVILLMLDDLIEISQTRSSKDYRNMEGTLILAAKLLSKAYLQLLHWLFEVETFSNLWVAILARMEKYMEVKFRGKRSEKLQELVPELLKNILLVMKARGILNPRNSASQGLWKMTWENVKNIDPSLQSDVFPDQELEQQPQQAESAGSSSNEAASAPATSSDKGASGAG